MSNDSKSQPAPKRRRGTRYYAVRLSIIGVILVTGLLIFFQLETRAELSTIAHGKQLVIANGCYACHGISDTDPRANLRQTSTGIWKSKSIPTFWENGIDTADLLIDWITHGAPDSEAESHKRLFIQMPAYKEFMEPAEIEAAAAWILAEAVRLTQGIPGSAPNLENDAQRIRDLDADRLMVIGDRLSRQHGCYQCHGELGQGGIENPGSFKNYIPGFFGRDFLKLTDGGDRDEILHWIDHGRGRAIEAGALGSLATRYFDGQAIEMPGYRDQLSPAEKTLLTEYLLLLNKEGPLSAKKLEQMLKLLNEEPSQNPNLPR